MQHINQNPLPVKSLNAASLAIIFAIAGFSIQLRASEPDKRLIMLEKITKADAAVQVWWLKPRNGKWTDFEFITVGGRPKADLIALLKNAVLAEKAGDFFTLEAPFAYLDKKGQGILVIQAVDGVRRIGFRFRAINVNKDSLEFIELIDFSPKERKIEYKLNIGLVGVVLGGDFRSILFKAMNASAKGVVP